MINAVSISNLNVPFAAYCSVCDLALMCPSYDQELSSPELHTSGFVCHDCRPFVAIADNALNSTRGIERPEK